MTVRRPAVAGTFYPGDPGTLRDTVHQLLAGAEARAPSPAPKALIAPHAGYIYSGPIAASAYALLKPVAARIRRVVLLGPSHFVPLDGHALPGVDEFATPLGNIPLDAPAMAALAKHPSVTVMPIAHAREHSLEVQLPFLQVVVPDFTLVPIAVGHADPEDTAELLRMLWGGPETLVVISSDLSHYHPYGAAVVLDRETTQAIERLDGESIDGDRACGCHPIRGLLHLAKQAGLKVVTLDQRNSGDTAGDRSRVVGYGSWAFMEAPA